MFSTFITHRILSLSFLLPLLFLSTGSFAQLEPEVKEQNHEKLYQVELIVFSRPETNSQERWPSDIKLGYPENILSLSDAGGSGSFSLLASTERSLNPQAATLARSGSYTVLFHQAWRQNIYASKTNIAISGGKIFNGHHELEGSISLSVGQYLKIQTNLWLTKFAPAGTPLDDFWPELPNLPNTFANDIDKSLANPIQRIVKLNQERTMRSIDVLYIDHPLMGLIIKIVPVESRTEKTN